MISIIKRNSSLRIFIAGALCGFSFTTVLLMLFPQSSGDEALNTRYHSGLGSYELQSPYDNKELITHLTPEPSLFTQDTQQLQQYQYQQKGEELAGQIANNVRLLCWIATMPKNHMTKAAVIKETWGKRCNILLFMSSVNDTSLPTVVLPVAEGREYLFDKTKAALKYIYKYYMESADWIFKADDDTFVVVENLRYLLSKYDPLEPLYLGCRFKPFVKQGFMSGGAGYVLSKTALKKVVEEAIPYKEKCLQYGSGEGEDVSLGICLENANVTAVDTRDEMKRARFFPYEPGFHLFPDHKSGTYMWYWRYQYYPNPEGLNCCSDTAVSFHYISPDQLHLFNYLVYTLRPYGTSLYYKQESTLSIEA